MNNINNYCYICSEFIGNANINITICNHYFHSSCLFDYVAINGFFCPNCLSSLTNRDEVIRVLVGYFSCSSIRERN